MESDGSDQSARERKGVLGVLWPFYAVKCSDIRSDGTVGSNLPSVLTRNGAALLGEI